MVQNQNNFTVLFVVMASTKIAHTVLLGLIQELTELYIRKF